MSNILLVEDDNNLALGLEYALTNEGYNVKVAKNLSEARGNFDEKNIKLILLDVMLPDGRGYDFCKEVRAFSDVPIIFLTAFDEEVNVIMGLDLGGDDYITKPVRIGELMSRIKAVLRRKGKIDNSLTNKYMTGELELSIEEAKVKKTGEELFLTPIEYKLLLSFIKNPKQVLSRQVLLQNIWDIDGNFIDDNTLSVHIRRLREKLDAVDTNKYIKTVRGIGYCWEMEVRSVNV